MDQTPPSAPACPICGQPTRQRYRPFCSKRCADIDLGRWLKGQYAVPAEEGLEPGDLEDHSPEDGDPEDDFGRG